MITSELYTPSQAAYLDSLLRRADDLKTCGGDVRQVEALRGELEGLIRAHGELKDRLAKLRPSAADYKTQFDKLATQKSGTEAQILGMIGEIAAALKRAQVEAFTGGTRERDTKSLEERAAELDKKAVGAFLVAHEALQERRRLAGLIQEHNSVWRGVASDCQGEEDVFSLGEDDGLPRFIGRDPVSVEGWLEAYAHQFIKHAALRDADSMSWYYKRG